MFRTLLDRKKGRSGIGLQGVKRAPLLTPDIVPEGARFIEIGPGQVLAGLLKRIVPEANVVSLGTADEVTKFMEAA